MICRRCLSRTSTQVAQAGRRIARLSPSLIRPLSTCFSRRNAAAAEAPAPEADSPPTFSTPLGDSPSDAKPTLSSCPVGTIMEGLNYLKNKTDPVALADDAYPAWLWDCLKVTEKHTDDTNADVEAEFSKSKKQRRLAAKRQRALEGKLLAEGNLEALAPKIPLQQQSINMPTNEEGTVEGSLSVVAAREDLRKAMRKERKAKIKEANYLKTM